MSNPLKPVLWTGDALDQLRSFPGNARSEAGYQLELVQKGDSPIDFRPMPGIGPGASEIRVHAGSEYRVFYVARFAETGRYRPWETALSRSLRKAEE